MPHQLCLIDSNILIQSVQPQSIGFHAATSAIIHLERLRSVCCYTSQNLAEFWNVLTRPANRNGYGLRPAEADTLAHVIETRFQLLTDTSAVHNEWRRLIVGHYVSGVQVHDARLVASMLVHGVHRILTFNTRDFQRFHEIEAVHPSQFAATP